MKDVRSRIKKLEGALKPLSPEPEKSLSTILLEKYEEAIFWLIKEMAGLMTGQPWFPKEPEKYFWARSELEKYLSEGGTLLKDFQWPVPREIPVIEEEELTDKRKEEIREIVNKGSRPGASGVDGVMACLAFGVYGDRVSGLNWPWP